MFEIIFKGMCFLFIFLILTLTVIQCRIVLERPEYGFATYFFELVESLPIAWQIKRLVAAMKLTCCGRISLLENKALRVTACILFMFAFI